MKTLQHAHEVLTDAGLSPFYQSETKIYKDKVLYSPYSVIVHCQQQHIQRYVKLLNRILPHFKVTYCNSLQELLIEPEDKKLQVIANAVDSCTTLEQVESAARLIENSYPEDASLILALTKKFNLLYK